MERTLCERGERKCLTCGEVHDAYTIGKGDPKAPISWGSSDDGHPYYPEPWESIARRLGFERGK